MELGVAGVFLLYICLCICRCVCVCVRMLVCMLAFCVWKTCLENLDDVYLELNNIIIYVFVMQQNPILIECHRVHNSLVPKAPPCPGPMWPSLSNFGGCCLCSSCSQHYKLVKCCIKAVFVNSSHPWLVNKVVNTNEEWVQTNCDVSLQHTMDLQSVFYVGSKYINIISHHNVC